jgi:hypothetical protein
MFNGPVLPPAQVLYFNGQALKEKPLKSIKQKSFISYVILLPLLNYVTVILSEIC